ncbi:UNVERIFIED_CONTAM: hypothetical protein GTU68_022631 [Idotea baltica]|nr:hypothetical protein [Idotea baltica]
MISFAGDINTGITLRTASIRDGKACIRAGATLLFDSDPKAEEQETRTKAAAFLSTLEKVRTQNASEDSSERSESKHTTIEPKKVLFIDCRDSFVHNLASYLREIGHEVVTYRSGLAHERILEEAPDLVFLSPGPGTPEEFGVPSLVAFLEKHKIPTFGVCLGLQGIGQAFGANLRLLDTPVHGKPSMVSHTGHRLFEGIQKQFSAGRYHSLYLETGSMPECLEICASTTQTIIDKTAHKTLPIAAVQFHPESLMTLGEHAGHVLLRNAIELLTKS